MDEIKKLIEEIFATLRGFQGRSDKNDLTVKQLQNKYDELVKQYVGLEIGGSGGFSQSNGQTRAYEGFNALLKDLKGDRAPQLNAHEYSEYRNAVRDYLRYGQSALDKSSIRDSLSVGSDPAGGYWVVPQRDMMPKEKLFMENPMRALAAVQNVLIGDAYQGLRDDDEFLSGWGHEAVERAKLDGVTWHTLRHTYASRLAMSGHSDRTIAALLRHSGTGLVQRYAHLSPTHLQEAVESLSTFGQPREIGTDTKIVNAEAHDKQEQYEAV